MVLKSKNVRISTDFDAWLNKHTGGRRSKIDLTKILADVLMGKNRGGKLI